MKNLNINIRCNIYIVLLLFLCYNSVLATTAFVAMPGTGGFSIINNRIGGTKVAKNGKAPKAL